MSDATPVPIQAAGCVLWRRAPEPDGHPLTVCLVHRPKYGDWSHPKGKLEPGEDPLTAAVREVREETGQDCLPGAPLSTLHYEAGGRPKVVRYWAAEATGGTFTPNHEIAEVRWVEPEEALLLLTQPRDRDLVAELLRLLGPPGPAGPAT
ncbi:hydrolase [Streptomyces albidoflavus]|uniref:NUDIX hydrolase n=1 Tax=Streptomyces albidoflavus TaxID=1886 RepID=UPI0007443B22|nr:NUDIX hydrolase [Streptomyces albidoflavus]KUL59542.1 hydrolase [Streptomyces albidoflavus]